MAIKRSQGKKFTVTALALAASLAFAVPISYAKSSHGGGGGGNHGGGGGGGGTTSTYLTSTLSGEAFGISADLSIKALGIPLATVSLAPTPLVTLPSGGGTVSNELLDVKLSALGISLINSGTADVFVTGATSKHWATVDSYATLEDLSVVNGLVVLKAISASCDSWGNGTKAASDTDGVIAYLSVAGVGNVTVTSAPNSSVSLLNGTVVLTLNQSSVSNGTTSTQGADTELVIQLNGANLLGTLTDLVTGTVKVSMASCGLNTNWAKKPPKNPDLYAFMTGGFRLGDQTGFANGGFNAGPRGSDSTPRGHFNYVDHRATAYDSGRMHLNGNVTYFTPYDNCADFGGTATINGGNGVNFDVYACDNGEPGKGADTVHLTVTDPGTGATVYDSDSAFSDVLAGGNLKMHTPN